MFMEETQQLRLLRTCAWSSAQWTPKPRRSVTEKGGKTSFCSFMETWSGEGRERINLTEKCFVQVCEAVFTVSPCLLAGQVGNRQR